MGWLDKFIEWFFVGQEDKPLTKEQIECENTINAIMDIVNADVETGFTITGEGVAGFSRNSDKTIHLLCNTSHLSKFELFRERFGKMKVRSLTFIDNTKRKKCYAGNCVIDRFDFSYLSRDIVVIQFVVEYWRVDYMYLSPSKVKSYFKKDKPVDSFSYKEYRKDFDYYGLRLEFVGEDFIVRYPEGWEEKYV